jgi:ABC-type transport system involved in multi-copper enzyme maturation permease subunit
MSPIHDQSYRRYEGTRTPPGRSWAVIWRAGVKQMLGRRAFLALLVLAWMPVVYRVIQIYGSTMTTAAPQLSEFLRIGPATFQSFLENQGIFVFFTTVYIGSGLIANDRRANALQIYLSKPLMRLEYIGGKLAILLTFLLMVTLVPAVLLLVLQAAFAGNVDLVRTHPYILPAIFLASMVRVSVAAFAMVALSALSKSSRYVAILYTGIIFFTDAVYGVMTVVTGSTRVAWISMTKNLDIVSDAMFRQPARYETPVIVSALALIGLVVVAISVLERRVRGVEIVA